MIKNANSSKNQKIKGKLVEKNVYSMATHIVEFILKVSLDFNDHDIPFSDDDIENLTCYNYENTMPEIDKTYPEKFFSISFEEDKEEVIEQINERMSYIDNEELKELDDKESELWSQYDSILDEVENLEEEPQEIFEWWIVSDWLYGKLKQENEPVIYDGAVYYWGRTCTGQAIFLDGVITKIAYDLGILEGQENEWEV